MSTTAQHVVNWLMLKANTHLQNRARRSFVWPPYDPDATQDGFILTADDGSEWRVLVTAAANQDAAA